MITVHPFMCVREPFEVPAGTVRQVIQSLSCYGYSPLQCRCAVLVSPMRVNDRFSYIMAPERKLLEGDSYHLLINDLPFLVLFASNNQVMVYDFVNEGKVSLLEEYPEILTNTNDTNDTNDNIFIDYSTFSYEKNDEKCIAQSIGLSYTPPHQSVSFLEFDMRKCIKKLPFQDTSQIQNIHSKIELVEFTRWLAVLFQTPNLIDVERGVRALISENGVTDNILSSYTGSEWLQMLYACCI